MREDKSLGQTFNEILTDLGGKAASGLGSFIQGWKERPKPIPAKDPKLVEVSPRVVKRRGLFLGLGLGTTILGGILDLTFLIEVLQGHPRSFLPLLFSLLVTLVGAGLLWRSSYYKKAAIRLEKYIRTLGKGTVSRIDEMAHIAGAPLALAQRDIQSFIQDNTFKEGQLVEGGQLFILDYPTYLLYKKQAASLDKVQAEELEAASSQEEMQGRETLAKIKALYPNLRQEGKNQLLPVITTIENIYQHVDQYPENKKALGKFNTYYLPTLAELVNRYILLQENDKSSQALQALRQLEEAFQEINQAFKDLLDQLGGDLARDSLSEVSVLKSLMKQEGLLKRDFELEENHEWKRN